MWHYRVAFKHVRCAVHAELLICRRRDLRPAALHQTWHQHLKLIVPVTNYDYDDGDDDDVDEKYLINYML